MKPYIAKRVDNPIDSLAREDLQHPPFGWVMDDSGRRPRGGAATVASQATGDGGEVRQCPAR